MVNFNLNDLKSSVQEIIDLIANKQNQKASVKIVEVKAILNDLLDHSVNQNEIREISKYQVLLKQLADKIMRTIVN